VMLAPHPLLVPCS